MLESVKKKLEEIQIKFSQMESELSKPETIENQTKFTSISKEYSNLKPIVDSFSEFKSVEENIDESNQLLNDSDSEIRALAQEELESLKSKKDSLEENLKKIRAWFLKSRSELLFHNNLFFITSFPEKAVEYGLSSSNIIKLDRAIGGRFSIWSSSNLVNAIIFGKEFFTNFLNGGKSIDNLVVNNFEKSLPYILALKSFYFRKYHSTYNHIVIPYSDQLSLLPSYLQQLVMESNGKSVNSFNENISNSPCSFIFGEVGTDAQHSFFQALHQSTLSFTGDLICFSNNLNSEFCIFDDYDKNNSKDLQNFAISQYLAFKNGSDKKIENVFVNKFLEDQLEFRKKELKI